MLLRRGFSTSIRRSGGDHMTTAKDVLPFNPDQNPWILLAKFCVFTWSACWLPFYTVTYHLKKEKEASG